MTTKKRSPEVYEAMRNTLNAETPSERDWRRLTKGSGPTLKEWQKELGRRASDLYLRKQFYRLMGMKDPRDG